MHIIWKPDNKIYITVFVHGAFHGTAKGIDMYHTLMDYKFLYLLKIFLNYARHETKLQLL